MDKYTERLEKELCRVLEKNSKLHAENESIKRKVVMYQNKDIDSFIEKLDRKDHEIEKLKHKVAEILRFRKNFPEMAWYTAYLQSTVSSLERMCDERQMTIEEYQRHLSKYGKLYRDFEDSKVEG